MINTNQFGALSTAARQSMLRYRNASRDGVQQPQSTATGNEPPRDTETIIVNGLRIPPLPQNYGLPWVNNGYEMGDLSNDWQENLDQFDQQNIDITTFLARPLSPTEQAAVNKLRQVIDNAKARIDAMPENATLRLSDGKTVTARELKDILARLDVEIYDGRVFRNDSHLIFDRFTGKPLGGEADYNNGNPVIRFNIGGVERYNASSGGIEYLFLHEVGHMVNSGNANLERIGQGGITPEESAAHERNANDIARAIGAYIGMPVLAVPGFGYDPMFPQFEVPNTPVPPSDPPPVIPSWPDYVPPGGRGNPYA